MHLTYWLVVVDSPGRSLQAAANQHHPHQLRSSSSCTRILRGRWTRHGCWSTNKRSHWTTSLRSFRIQMNQAARRRSDSNHNTELAAVMRCTLAHFCFLAILFVSSSCSSALLCPRSNNLQQYEIVQLPSVAQKQTNRAERPVCSDWLILSVVVVVCLFLILLLCCRQGRSRCCDSRWSSFRQSFFFCNPTTRQGDRSATGCSWC